MSFNYSHLYVRSHLPAQSDGDDDKSLAVKSLKKYLYYKKCRVAIDVKESCIRGNLQAENDSEASSFEGRVCSFLETQQFGIVEANNMFFAIWKFEEELQDKSKETGFYLIHDNPPKSFLNQVLSDPDQVDASASVFRFLDATELAMILKKLLQVENEQDKSDYFIHQVQVVSVSEPMTDEEIQKDQATPVKPDLRNYVAFGDSGATLAGSFNQSNEELFKRETRDKQQAANALVTLAMIKIFDPYFWYREIVDDILKIGDKLTRENLKNLPEGDDEDADTTRDYLLPSEVENDFALGVNQISVTLEEDIFSGQLNELQQHLQDFFSSNRMGVFRQDKTILPIWREERVYFTMDPVGNQTGNACVYWFTNIQSFTEMLLECSGKTDGNFAIDNAVVENKLIESDQPQENLITQDHWYNFSKQSEGIWQISCKRSNETDDVQEDDIRENDGTAISIMAIIFSQAYEPRFWSAELLHEITTAGKTLHSQSAARLGEDKHLRPSEMINEFFISNRRIDLKIQDCVQAGKVKSKISRSPSLREGCVKFFEKFTACCLSLPGSTALAVWTIDDHFYSFKPEKSLMRFEDLGSLVDTLEMNGQEDDDFEMTSVEVVDWNKCPPWQLDPSPAVRPSDLPPLNAYSRLPGQARAILRGSTHQESEMFPEDARGRQTAANCIASLAMSVIKNPITWTRGTLDGILTFGLNLHLESLEGSAAGPLPSLKPQDIVRIFQLGPNVLTVDVEAATVTGIVEEPPPEAGEAAKVRKNEKQGADKAKGKDVDKKKGGQAKRTRPEPPRPPLLAEALERFFDDNSAGVLVTGRFMAAIWRSGGVYFMYDPGPRDNQGRRAAPRPREPSASCACWFACRQPLLRLLAANVPDAERHEPFRICRVLARRLRLEPLPAPLTRRPEGLAPDSDFERAGKRLSVLPAASLHLRATTFPAERRGRQSSAVALAALALAGLHAPASWTPALLDAVLRHGDALHAEGSRLRRQGPRGLAPAELPREFALGELRARLRLAEGLTAGLTLERDLLHSLALFFGGGADAGALHTSELTLALARHGGRFYVLDPTDCCPLRRPAQPRGAAASLVRCDDLAALARAVLAVLAPERPTVYALDAVWLEELRFFSR